MTTGRQLPGGRLAYLAEIPRLKQADQPQQNSTKASTRHVAGMCQKWSGSPGRPPERAAAGLCPEKALCACILRAPGQAIRCAAAIRGDAAARGSQQLTGATGRWPLFAVTRLRAEGPQAQDAPVSP
jgi:hypothetical protein